MDVLVVVLFGVQEFGPQASPSVRTVAAGSRVSDSLLVAW